MLVNKWGHLGSLPAHETNIQTQGRRSTASTVPKDPRDGQNKETSKHDKDKSIRKTFGVVSYLRWMARRTLSPEYDIYESLNSSFISYDTSSWQDDVGNSKFIPNPSLTEMEKRCSGHLFQILGDRTLNPEHGQSNISHIGFIFIFTFSLFYVLSNVFFPAEPNKHTCYTYITSFWS